MYWTFNRSILLCLIFCTYIHVCTTYYGFTTKVYDEIVAQEQIVQWIAERDLIFSFKRGEDIISSITSSSCPNVPPNMSDTMGHSAYKVVKTKRQFERMYFPWWRQCILGFWWNFFIVSVIGLHFSTQTTQYVITEDKVVFIIVSLIFLQRIKTLKCKANLLLLVSWLAKFAAFTTG